MEDCTIIYLVTSSTVAKCASSNPILLGSMGAAVKANLYPWREVQTRYGVQSSLTLAGLWLGTGKIKGHTSNASHLLFLGSAPPTELEMSPGERSSMVAA